MVLENNMKILAANQPYLFPYIGYFQLINSVDVFLLVGNLQFISRGWINRNRYKPPGESEKYITFPVSRNNHLKNICDNYYVDFDNQKKIFRKKILQYRKAKNYSDIECLVDQILKYDCANVADFNSYSIKKICEYLNIKTTLIRTEQEKDSLFLQTIAEDTKEKRIVDFCKYYDCTYYRNAIGGLELYNRQYFEDNNIEIQFLKTDFENDDNLSVIDYMLKHSREECIRSLSRYSIV